ASPSVAQVDPVARVAIARSDDPIPNQYIVTLRSDVTDVGDRADALAAQHGGTVVATFSHALRGFTVQMADSDAAALSRDPSVAAVEQDGYVSAAATEAAASWGLDRIDQRDRPLDNSYTYLATGRRVTAYVIDTGIRTTHAD